MRHSCFVIMITCPFCGAENIEGADLCDECEHSLTDVGVREPATAVERGLLRRLPRGAVAEVAGLDRHVSQAQQRVAREAQHRQQEAAVGGLQPGRDALDLRGGAVADQQLQRRAGAGPEHLVRLTWYVTDKREYLARLREVGEAYRAVLGRHFPAMTMVQVAALIEDRAKVEIEATAVLPNGAA